MTRKPRAYRLDDADLRPGETRDARAGVRIEVQADEIVEAADGTPVPMGHRKGLPWGGILLGALSTLVAIAVGLGVESLIRSAFTAAPWLGWAGLVALVLAVLALAILVGREIAGLWREKKIEALRERAAAAIAARDGKAAQGVVGEVVALYAGRPETARGRGGIAAAAEEILEAEDRIALAERLILADLDERARRVVTEAAKQVSLVTALSPRAAIDMGFVVFTAARVLRRVSAVYGARPGLLGFLRLMRAALTHLTVTGGVAVGDSLLQQALGLGLAARVSARLGEGVLNGIMTARFGLAAIAVCRPLPFVALAQPRIGDVAGDLISRKVVEDAKD